MMDGSTGALGIVSSAPGISNPSDIAYSLLCESILGLEYGYLIRPCILCGPSIRQYAEERGLLKSVAIPQKRREEGEKYLHMIKRKHETEVYDTVGCIVLNETDIVAAGSSGGNWMSIPGRSGLCSIPGAGVWCDSDCACISSGIGESCIRRLFAKGVCDLMKTEKDHEIELERILVDDLETDMNRMNITLDPSFGVIVVNKGGELEMIVSHSSEMFGYGYIHVSDSELSDENGIQKNVIVKISTKDVSKKCATNRIVFYSVYS